MTNSEDLAKYNNLFAYAATLEAKLKTAQDSLESIFEKSNSATDDDNFVLARVAAIARAALFEICGR